MIVALNLVDTGGNVKMREISILLAIFSLIAPLAIGGDFQYYKSTAIGCNSDLEARLSQQRSFSLNLASNGCEYPQNKYTNEKYRPSFKLVLAGPQDDSVKNFPLPHNNDTVRSDAHQKEVYLVCAGRYSVRADAEKHIETLRQFGYSSKLNLSSRNTFRVVLGKSDKSTKAAKMKSSFEKKGVSCFVEKE
jgi:cell division protein FtsN